MECLNGYDDTLESDVGIGMNSDSCLMSECLMNGRKVDELVAGWKLKADVLGGATSKTSIDSCLMNDEKLECG